MTDRSTDHWSGRHYHADHITGPVGFLNPTTRFLPVHRPRARIKTQGQGQGKDQDQRVPAVGEHGAATSAEKSPASPGLETTPSRTGVYNVWHSRDNRKGRHALALSPSAVDSKTGVVTAPAVRTNTWSATLAGISRMLLRYPVWDISYDVAVVFTLGSVVWVLNGFFVLLPLTNPADTFSGESAWGGGVSAVVGATIFEVGSILLMLEAVNENRSECFGWALKEGLQHSEENLLLLKRDKSGCQHHHVEKGAWLSRKGVGHDGAVEGGKSGGEQSGDDVAGEEARAIDQEKRRWTWWPSWYELRTHYFRDIGFLACLSQMIGATVFWISGWTGLPQILGVLSLPATNGIYWLPQVVGGTGFIISSWLFMLETQRKWYVPAPNVLGWHIGFYNLIGAIGFSLCGAFGFASSNEACEIALTWSTFIGSWAFLIGSIIQWYESMDKYPVIIDNTIPAKCNAGVLARQTDGQA